MTTRIATFIHTLTHSSTIHMLLALALLGSFVTAAPVFADDLAHAVIVARLLECAMDLGDCLRVESVKDFRTIDRQAEDSICNCDCDVLKVARGVLDERNSLLGREQRVPLADRQIDDRDDDLVEHRGCA